MKAKLRVLSLLTGLPKAHQCLYVSTLPFGVIKYVHC
jgi:hypothetical protein